MEALLVEIVPDFYDVIGEFAVSGAEFFAAGALVLIIAWTIGFAVGEVFRLLERDVLGRG